MMEPALQVSGPRKTFGGFTLNDVSFNLPKGYVMGLVGPNGAGKTTIIALASLPAGVAKPRIRLGARRRKTGPPARAGGPEVGGWRSEIGLGQLISTRWVAVPPWKDSTVNSTQPLPPDFSTRYRKVWASWPLSLKS